MAISFSNLGGKKIPTIIGIILLLVGMVAGVLAVGQSQGWFTKAGPTSTPRSVRITNIKEDGFTVSWISDTSVSGFVKYGTTADRMTQTLGDDRDQVSGTAGLFTTHYVTLKGLKPKTPYFFLIGSGSVTYDSAGKPYTQVTAGAIGSPAAADTINGKVLLASGQPAPGVIVYVDLPDGSTLSSITRSSGVWSLPLSQMRTSDLSKYLTYDKTAAAMTIVAQGADLGAATATTTTANDTPVPDISLGSTQNFVAQVATPSAVLTEDLASPSAETSTPAAVAPTISPSGSPSAGFSALSSVTPAEEATLSVKLLTIRPNETVATSSPEIKLSAPVGTKVTITVRSDNPQTTTITAGTSGVVDWVPPEGLEPGEHTATIQYTDSDGIVQTITRTFTVLAAESSTEGSLPAFTASASAEPTSTVTLAPRAAMPSTESGVPATGVALPTYLLLLGGGLLFFGGLAWQKKRFAEID